MTTSRSRDVLLLVCQTCRRTDKTEGTVPAGAWLLKKLQSTRLPDGVTVKGVSCLSNCKKGCTIVLQAPARWTYIYGNINPVSDLEQLCTGIAAYIESNDGVVPWKERVALFRKNSIARIPPTIELN